MTSEEDPFLHMADHPKETRDGDQHDHDQPTDGGEKGEKGKDLNTPVGFWNKELNGVRKEVFKKFIITTLILIVAILGILSLYWAALFRVEQNMSALVVWVVDFDGQVAPYTDVTPIVGPQIVSAAEALIAPSGAVGWGSMPASAFNYDPMAVRKAVYDQKCWAAIVINANATALLQSAVQTGNASYDPLGIAQTIYTEAREDQTYYDYILPQLNQFQTSITSKFGEMWARQVFQQAANNATILTNIGNAPQAISPAIGFSIYSLRPFLPPTATPSVTIGLIYLIIISFFSFNFYLPIHSKFITPQGHPPMHFYQLIIWRWIATITAYFFLSFFYSIISLAFQIPFSAPALSDIMVENPTTKYGKGSFPVYWMLNWVGMGALGLACENVAMFVGQPWTAFWLIFWVISNVSTSFYAIELAPHFYYWGYAWPLHNIVEASRTIIFNLHSRIGLNFGILFAWCAVNTLVFPAACYFMRWQTKKQEKKEE